MSSNGRYGIAPFAALLSIVLLAALSRAQSSVAPSPVDPSSVNQELRIRTWAILGVGRELEAALESERWEQRVAALEALHRRGEFGGELVEAWRARVRARLDDPHPNVRARALQVLGQVGECGSGRLSAAHAQGFERDPLPLVRLALCQALARLECDVPADFLQHLAHDEDGRVRDAARAVLAGERPGAPTRSWSKAELLAELGVFPRERERVRERERERERAELRRFFRRLERTPLTPDEWAAFGALPELSRPAIPSREKAFRGLVEALRFAHTETGDDEIWMVGFVEAEAHVLRWRELFLLAARSESEVLARRWLEFLAPMRLVERGDRLVADFVEALLLMLAPERLAQLALEVGLGELLWIELLPELGHGMQRWDPALVAALLAERPTSELRHATVEALGLTLDREGEHWKETAALLVLAADSPLDSLAARALRQLLDCPEPRAFEEEIHRIWSRLPVGRQEELLGRIPRDVPLEPFASEWLRLGADRSRTRVACELLRPFLATGTSAQELVARIHEALLEWLEPHLRDLDRDLDAGGVSTVRMSRRSELGMQAIVATMALDPVPFLPAFDRVLSRTVGVSKDVTKAVFEALKRTPAGLLRLETYLDERFDARTRVEAALHLVGVDASSPAGEELAARSFAVLRASYDASDRELRRRMLRSLEGYAADEALDFLGSFVFASRSSPEERALALSTLSRQHHPERRALLLRAVSEAGDIEARLLAARALGRAGDAEAIDDLRAALAAVREELRLGDEERELLRAELVLSMGRTGHFPVDGEGLLDAPLAKARAEMEQRFRGEELGRISFAWRAELYLAQALAKEGRVGAELDRAAGWMGLDGRFLMRLGSIVLQAGEAPAGRRLLEAGLVASAGDADPDLALRLEARSRLLGLAWSEERFGDAERLATSLLLEYRSGDLPEAAFGRAFGVFDPLAGIDPRGRLESARLQARAYRALSMGEKDRARTLAREARRRMGSSELSLKEQERLEGRL